MVHQRLVGPGEAFLVDRLEAEGVAVELLHARHVAAVDADVVNASDHRNISREADQSGSTHLVLVTRGERYLVFVQPPSTTIDWPLTISELSEHRKAITEATSSASASRG